MHGLVGILGAQALDLVIDDAGLHRAAARAVDAQDHTGRMLVLEGVGQRRGDVVGAVVAARLDDPLQLDQGGVSIRGRRLLAENRQVEQHDDRERNVGEGEELEKDTPAARGLLLGQRGERQFLDGLAFPAWVGDGGVGRGGPWCRTRIGGERRRRWRDGAAAGPRRIRIFVLHRQSSRMMLPFSSRTASGARP